METTIGFYGDDRFMWQGKEITLKIHRNHNQDVFLNIENKWYEVESQIPTPETMRAGYETVFCPRLYRLEKCSKPDFATNTI